MPEEQPDEIRGWTDARCCFQRTDDDGNVLFHCKRTDSEIVWLAGGGHVVLCSQHRSWGAALGRTDG